MKSDERMKRMRIETTGRTRSSGMAEYSVLVLVLVHNRMGEQRQLPAAKHLPSLAHSSPCHVRFVGLE